MRVVIKIGTSTLTHQGGGANFQRIELLCRTIADIKNAGHEVIVVSSAAIALGAGKLHMSERPDDVPSRQALAAVGQCELMYMYDRLFAQYNHVVGQVLLTAEDIQSGDRRSNVKATLTRLLELDVLPIINENDTVATAELEGGVIGDNDKLSAQVAVFVEADLLVMLTDIPGLYTCDPRQDDSAELIPLVTEITDEMVHSAGGSGTDFGTGGMKTKLQAAQILQDHHINMVITAGQNPECLYRIMAGEPVGTRFVFDGQEK